MIYLDLEELLYVVTRTLGTEPEVRDYPGVDEKAAALLHSLARNHALVDGNKRLALAATIAFYGMNGIRLTLTNDEAYELVVDVARGRLDEVPAIASVLQRSTEPR